MSRKVSKESVGTSGEVEVPSNDCALFTSCEHSGLTLHVAFDDQRVDVYRVGVNKLARRHVLFAVQYPVNHGI